MFQFLLMLVSAGGVILAAGVLLQLLTRLGRLGRAMAAQVARAPMLDVVVFLLAVGPWVIAPIVGGWSGLLGAVLGQLLGVELWIGFNEVGGAFRAGAPHPRIVRVLNRAVGTWRNQLALIVTLVALPAFLFIRAMQFLAYPWLVRLLGFPRYRHRDWINVSRHKFDGLYGHDLFWCLYCDWMTGVYALGAEMLRNVESFWCPIRFTDPAKCDHCRIDFPDVDRGWVDAGGGMKDVERVLETQYGHGRREWFGHPARVAGVSDGHARLTVNGESIEPAESSGREATTTEQ